MSKVTRIAYGKNVTRSKLRRLTEIARRLGAIRSETWRKFGSVSGLKYSGDRAIRDKWLDEGREFNVPARLWKATLSDTMSDLVMYREASKAKVRSAIGKRTKDEDERKRLYTMLKYDGWHTDPYLRRMMRKYYKHGRTSVNNQIVLDTGCYTTFEHGGRAWIAVQSLDKGKRIAIPLNTNRLPTGTIRLILSDGNVEVHYAADANEVCSVRTCGDKTIGIDKGYTEAFTDSDGEKHGEGLGAMLSAQSDANKEKYRHRNKLKALVLKHENKGRARKAKKIRTHNLGRKKLDARKRKHTANVRNVIFNAAHTIVNKARTIAVEDLTSTIPDKKLYGPNMSRRLSGWTKGVMAEAISAVTSRRGASAIPVSCAYTSQMDSRFGLLLGTRIGDTFYCYDGVVLDADWNAARNVLARMNDPDIGLYTPYTAVKSILAARTESRLGLLNQDISCGTANISVPSTMRELPNPLMGNYE